MNSIAHRVLAATLARVASELADVARSLAEGATDDPAELIPIDRAAQIARVSRRTLRDAARSGEIALFGRQRSRTVRRADLMSWIEGRRAPVVRDDADDRDLERRMARLRAARATKGRAA